MVPDGGTLEALLVRVAAGDRVAFRSLYQRAAGPLLAVALAVTRNRDAAEEAVQDGFLRIWERAGRFDPARGGAMPWMAAVVRNLAIERRPVRQTITIPCEEAGEDALPGLIAAYDLSRSLRRLERGPRTAILLNVVYGFSHRELATLLKVPEGTAKSWVRRGLVRLRSCLEPPPSRSAKDPTAIKS